jgi:hypothetical protein
MPLKSSTLFASRRLVRETVGVACVVRADGVDVVPVED